MVSPDGVGTTSITSQFVFSSTRLTFFAPLEKLARALSQSLQHLQTLAQQHDVIVREGHKRLHRPCRLPDPIGDRPG